MEERDDICVHCGFSMTDEPGCGVSTHPTAEQLARLCSACFEPLDRTDRKLCAACEAESLDANGVLS